MKYKSLQWKKRKAVQHEAGTFQQTFQITQAAHQSHLVYRVYVPEEVSDLEVHFQYGPIVERDQQMIRKAVRREGLNESVVQYDTTIRNLLTVSINDPNQYRGAHHFFAEKQKIIISETEATEGFITGKLLKDIGNLSLVVMVFFQKKLMVGLRFMRRQKRSLNK